MVVRGDDLSLHELRGLGDKEPGDRKSGRARLYSRDADPNRHRQRLETNMSEDNGDNRVSAGRREYDNANVALDSHIKKNDARLRKFFIGALIAFSIIGLACTVALIGYGIVLREQQQTADQLAILVKQNKDFARDIQKQRKDSIIESCTTQNARHDGSVKALVKGSDIDQENAANEAARVEIRRRRDVTIALLDALAPVEDCKAKAKEAVQGG